MVYILYDSEYFIRVVSSNPVKSNGMHSLCVNDSFNSWNKKIYKKLPLNIIKNIHNHKQKPKNNLKIALVCNWKDQCGIAAYSDFLTSEMKKKVEEVKIFSEKLSYEIENDESERCWTRGESLKVLAQKIIKYNPDYIIIQHEFGIFPNAFHFMKLMEYLKNIPTVVVLHSVYTHLDKSVYTNCIKNIIVHTKEAQETLNKVGNYNNIYVVPHGCPNFKETSELWNIFQNPYTILQFGFGFSYKGVDRAINAIADLRNKNEKYKNLQYLYLCSTNEHNKSANNEYCKKLIQLTKQLEVEDNVLIVQKYQTEEMINRYLRLSKVIIFPYIIDENNEVFGSSGAIRIAMANKKPVIASESHLFDDLENIVPRPKNHIQLSNEIDKIFSNEEHKNNLINKSSIFIKNNTWDIICDKYLDVYNQIVNQQFE